MRQFLQRHQDQILAVLSGFDRMRFGGTLRLLQSEGGVATWLQRLGVAVKDFLSFAEGLTQRFCRQTDRWAELWGRKVRYLPGVVDKEDLVQQIRQQEGVADNGVVAVLSTLEMGMSYSMFRRRDNDFAVLKRAPRKCKHYYFYWEDDRFGLTQVRVSSWFPFDVHVVLNGREWLARQMDAQGIGYLRRDNCLLQISDFEGAQQLAEQQPKIKWRGQSETSGRGDTNQTWGVASSKVASGKWYRRSLMPLATRTCHSAKVYRTQQDDPGGQRQWLALRKTVADLPRRARLSQSANERYLEALSTITADTPLSALMDKLCQRVEVTGRWHRGLRPFDPEDVPLLQAVSRGEFLLSGFRNRDVRQSLYGETEDALERRRQSGRVSRKLAMLRAHGLIKKIPRTHRYLLTETGVLAVTAILSAREASISQLVAA